MPPRFSFSGDRVRARRKQLRLTRDLVAFSIGVTTDTVGNWERGFCGPRYVETLTALAEILECEVQDLFEEVPANA